MPENYSKKKVSEVLKTLAADFLQKESSGKSLITVTDCTVADNQRNAVIFFSVLPAEAEEEALNFTKRQRREFREYIKKHSRLRYVPFVDFEIDLGEKNRQRIEELLNE
ncbi:ribosome-binding factor A [Patescibacteria group bacterium]